MFVIQNKENWKDVVCIKSISEIARFLNLSENTLYDYFSRQKLTEIEYKGLNILKRQLFTHKRLKNDKNK